jgi:hypothetical protein
MNEPCPDCDFIGPLWPVTQQSTDLHRAWHDLTRAGARAFREIRAAFARAAESARTATAANYALTPPQEDHPVTTTPTLETWRVEPGDDIKLTRKMSTVAGQVTRIDLSATKGTGFYFHGRPLPYWVGHQHDTWTLTEHNPAIPRTLHVNALYDITTDDGRTLRAYWSPLDGFRANHPWLHPDGETRYRQGYVTRARLAPTEGDNR